MTILLTHITLGSKWARANCEWWPQSVVLVILVFCSHWCQNWTLFCMGTPWQRFVEDRTLQTDCFREVLWMVVGLNSWTKSTPKRLTFSIADSQDIQPDAPSTWFQQYSVRWELFPQPWSLYFGEPTMLQWQGKSNMFPSMNLQRMLEVSFPLCACYILYPPATTRYSKPISS